MSIQLFRDTEFNNRFDEWIGTVKKQQGRYAWQIFDDFATSAQFGFFIWDNSLNDLTDFFSRDYFANNWGAIIESLEFAGTYQSYITAITSALGPGTLIDFQTPNPSHLIINVTVPTGAVQWSAFHNGEYVDIVPFGTGVADATMVLQQSVAALTVNETIKLIQLLNVNGVFVETNFT